MPHPQLCARRETDEMPGNLGVVPVPQAPETAGAPCRERWKPVIVLANFAGFCSWRDWELQNTRRGVRLQNCLETACDSCLPLSLRSPASRVASDMMRQRSKKVDCTCKAEEIREESHRMCNVTDGTALLRFSPLRSVHSWSRTMRSATFVLAAITSGNRWMTSKEGARL